MNKELKIAEAIEIAKFLKEKADARSIKNKDIIDAFMEYDYTLNYDTAKNLVSKLISVKNKNLRIPTPQQALWLSRILNVSMEEIYLAKDKYNSPKCTLRQLAYEGDYTQIKMMSKGENGVFDYYIAYDEYDKTLFHYLVEFEKIDIINDMMKDDHSRFEFLTYLKDDLIKLAIKYDNVELFNNLYCWVMPIYIKEYVGKDVYTYPTDLVISERDFIEMLSKKNIINSFLKKQQWTDGYWRNRMHFAQFCNPLRQDITTALQQQAQILSPNLNLLLKYAIKEKIKNCLI